MYKASRSETLWLIAVKVIKWLKNSISLIYGALYEKIDDGDNSRFSNNHAITCSAAIR